MQLYLIRHGQSENNARYAETGSEQGRHYDPALTAKGEAQARYAAAFLCSELGLRDPLHQLSRLNGHSSDGAPLTHLYSSLMSRAVATGLIISRHLGLPLRALPEAHEAGGLYLEDEVTGEKRGVPGPNRNYFSQNFPDLILPEKLGELGWWNRPHEEKEELPPRARRVWEELLARHGNTHDRVGLITHGGFYNHLIKVIIGAPPENTHWFTLNNAAISRVDVNQYGVALVYLNRFDFLPPDLITL